MEEKRNATLRDLRLEMWLRLRDRDGIIWKTSDGAELSLRRMSDRHVIRAIECLEKLRDDMDIPECVEDM